VVLEGLDNPGFSAFRGGPGRSINLLQAPRWNDDTTAAGTASKPLRSSGLRAWVVSGRVPVPVTAPTPTQTDWVKSVLFDRGYLARIRGDAIKVYLVMLEASGGRPDTNVTISLNQLMARTRLSCPTVVEGLARLEQLGLVVSTTHERGKVKSYYVSDPPAAVDRSA
jgi:hypothetical protein